MSEIALPNQRYDHAMDALCKARSDLRTRQYWGNVQRAGIPSLGAAQHAINQCQDEVALAIKEENQ